MPGQSSTDTTVPNAARVYDYVLGGRHNFEADRQAAEYMISLVPSTRKWVQMLRMFLREATLQLAEEGFDKFLDFASGLPTVDHIHQTVPDARVIYVDNDPVTVELARDIIGENENVRYLKMDIRDVKAIFDAPAVEELFGDDREVAIGFNAVSCFFPKEKLQGLMKDLYEGVAPGSKMFATFETKQAGAMTPRMKKFVDMFDQMGSPYHFLTREECSEVIKPWQPDERGFQPLAKWLDAEDHFTEEDREGVGLEFYGAFLVK